MPWYFYVLQVIGGMLVTNGIPHWVQGLSGAPFQSPFARPPGVGESSPLINAYWGLANVIGGGVLIARFASGDALGWICLCAGAVVLSTQASHHFGKVRAARATS